MPLKILSTKCLDNQLKLREERFFSSSFYLLSAEKLVPRSTNQAIFAEIFESIPFATIILSPKDTLVKYIIIRKELIKNGKRQFKTK